MNRKPRTHPCVGEDLLTSSALCPPRVLCRTGKGPTQRPFGPVSYVAPLSLLWWIQPETECTNPCSGSSACVESTSFSLDISIRYRERHFFVAQNYLVVGPKTHGRRENPICRIMSLWCDIYTPAVDLTYTQANFNFHDSNWDTVPAWHVYFQFNCKHMYKASNLGLEIDFDFY